MIVWQHVKNSWIFPFSFIPEARLRSDFFKTRASGFMRVSKHSKTIKNTRPAASCFHQFSCVWKPRWNPRTCNVNVKEEANAHQLILPFKPLSTRWEWLLNLCLEANLDKRNVNTDIKKGRNFWTPIHTLQRKGRLWTSILKWILSLWLPLSLLLFTVLDIIHILLTCFYWPRKIKKKTHKGKKRFDIKGKIWLMKTVKSIYFYSQPSKTQININHQTI